MTWLSAVASRLSVRADIVVGKFHTWADSQAFESRQLKSVKRRIDEWANGGEANGRSEKLILSFLHQLAADCKIPSNELASIFKNRRVRRARRTLSQDNSSRVTFRKVAKTIFRYFNNETSGRSRIIDRIGYCGVYDLFRCGTSETAYRREKIYISDEYNLALLINRRRDVFRGFCIIEGNTMDFAFVARVPNEPLSMRFMKFRVPAVFLPSREIFPGIQMRCTDDETIPTATSAVLARLQVDNLRTLMHSVLVRDEPWQLNDVENSFFCDHVGKIKAGYIHDSIDSLFEKMKSSNMRRDIFEKQGHGFRGAVLEAFPSTL